MLAVAVGNSRVRWGVFEGSSLIEAHSVPNAKLDELVPALKAHADVELAAVASVNDPVASEVEKAIYQTIGGSVGRINRDIPIPLKHTIEEAHTLGVDRAVSALAAWQRAQQACVVIDAGTAITVDFVDGKGVFQGGAILPGGGLMLKALHGGTAQLPLGTWPPAEEPPEVMGHNTADAMLTGVLAAARGSVRYLIERYSEFYGAYPQVIATGGDAPLLFDGDELVEHIIPDLQLMGIRACVDHARSDA